jgi:hypothetical protein
VERIAGKMCTAHKDLIKGTLLAFIQERSAIRAA